MAITQAATEEHAEAVIISGPPKGEFITVPPSESEWNSRAEALLGSLIADAECLADSARAAAAEADALLQDLRQARGR